MIIEIGKVKAGKGNPFFLIAGPCVIEGEEICLDIAAQLKRLTSELAIPFIFKSSFDKANRSSINSFRGLGVKEGLNILSLIKKELNIPILSDVHRISQINMVEDVLDMIQIPAFLSRQTDLILEASKTGKPINIKKGQFMAPWEIRNTVKKIESTGNKKILITERGTSFGYNNLVVDFRGLEIMKEFGYPVGFDATHSVQLPGGGGDVSSGESRFAFPLAKAAVAVGCDFLYMEVHKNPEKALCDGPNMLSLEELKPILEKTKQIDLLIKKEMKG